MKYLVMLWRCALVACLILWLASSASNAQSVRGGLAGTIADSTGAVVAGANVQAKNETTSDVSNTVSTSAGAYRFPELPLGTYDITVTAAGFQKSISKGVLIQIQQITALNVSLKPGGSAETVTVDANAPTIETETSDIGGVVAARQIVELPLALGGVGALRSPEAFEFLLPGTTGPGTANSNNGIFLSKIAGGQNYGNEVLIDGASQQRSENGSSFDEEAPSVEALQEFKITTAMPQAEYGRTTGGIENFVTKSGTNGFHGTAYDIFRNDDLDANTWFANGYRALNCTGDNDTPTCRAQYARGSDKKNDYGGTLGGPIRIPKLYNGTDKLFFFFSWEQLKYTQSQVETSTVPTAQELGGDFSNPAIYNPASTPIGTNPCDGTPVYNGEIFDPATTRTVTNPDGSATECRTQFPGNKIPTTRFSPASQNLLSYFPAATNQNTPFNNFSFEGPLTFNNTTETIRIDANLSQKNKIWGSYSSRENNRISGNNPILPNPIDPNTWDQDFTTHFGRFGWDYTITPSLLNHFNFGTNRSNSKNYSQAIFNGINYTSKAGIAGVTSFNFPIVTNGFTAQEGNAQNDDNVDNGMRLNESVAWEKGRHSFAFGGDIRWQQYSPLNGNNPAISFCGNQTEGAPTLGGTGNGLASELLGQTCNGTQTAYAHQARWTSWYWALFAQDDFKITKDLTLNLGIRYDVDLPRHEAENDTSNFSPTANDPEFGVPGALVFGSTCHGCNTAWANSYYKDIAPRIGFAYSPSSLQGKTAFRGGFGILYGPLQYSDFGGSMVSGYSSSQISNNNGFDPSFQLDSGFPAFPQPPILDPGLYNGKYVPGSYIQPHDGKPAAIYEWNMQLQQQLAQDLIMTIGYVGNEGQNLHSNIQNLNNIPISNLARGQHLNDQLNGNADGVAVPFPGYFGLWGNGVTIQQALRPFPQYDFIDTGCCLENAGHSSYDALLATLQRRFRNGINLLASYTWSKSITNSDSLLPNNGVAVPQEQNPANLKAEKAISFQDVPQTFVVSYLYELPIGKNKGWLNHGPASYAVSGWQIGGVQRYMSGQPMGFCCASGIPGWQNSIRFNRIPGSDLKSPVYHAGHNANHLNPFNTSMGTDPFVNSMFNGSSTNGAYLNAGSSFGPAAIKQAAFFDENAPQNVGTGAFTLGDTPRVTGEVRTPSYYNEDFAILKNTAIKEGLSFQLKFELLNAFNRHTFSYPDQGPNDYLFGVPTGTVNTPRNVQITGRINF